MPVFPEKRAFGLTDRQTDRREKRVFVKQLGWLIKSVQLMIGQPCVNNCIKTAKT